MRIVITGGAGFIGSQLGKSLYRQGHEVILLDNMSYGHLDNLLLDGAPFGRFVCKDIRDPDMVALIDGAEVVVHLAGIAALPACQSDPRTAYDVNVAGLGNVLEASRRAGVRRVLFSSTSAVYENTKLPVLAEDAPIAPDLVYAMTKAAGEKLCEGFASSYGMDIVICRFFNVFGPHQDVQRLSPPFTSYVARELVMGRQPVLYNNSDARRDYVHSNDVLELLTRMAFAEGRFAAERFNICSGVGSSVPELYALFQSASGSDLAPVFADPATFWDRYPELVTGPNRLPRERIVKEVYKDAIGDPAKAEAAFGFRPSSDIGAGVASVYADALRRLKS